MVDAPAVNPVRNAVRRPRETRLVRGFAPPPSDAQAGLVDTPARLQAHGGVGSWHYASGFLEIYAAPNGSTT